MAKVVISVFLCLFFLAPAAASAGSVSIYVEVYYDTFEMAVWRITPDGVREEVGVYPVVLTWKDYKLPQIARITRVETDPRWWPTSGVKARYLEKYNIELKNEYGPNDPMNAMGRFKWTLSFLDMPGYYPGEIYARVHEAKDPAQIGTRASSGCVRLLQADGLFLTELLKEASERIIVYTKRNEPLDGSEPASLKTAEQR